jgi:SPP1 gp7 family putative phage head morphogenesis protein
MARQIMGLQGIGGRFGLTGRQEQIVANYRAALEAAIRGDISFAELQARYELNAVRGPGGLVEGRADSAVARYEERLLRNRARNIARTETILAAEEGRNQAWEQAQERGAIAQDQEREWLTAEDERVCPICGPLDGERVGLREAFSGGFSHPPAHPQCRCSTVLVFD